MSQGILWVYSQGLITLNEIPHTKVATLPGQRKEEECRKSAMEKYNQELKAGLFMLEECEEAIKSEEKEEVDLAFEKICAIIKRLGKSKDDITEAMLSDQETIGKVREWNNKQKEEIRPLREMRKMLKIELEKYDEQMYQKKQQRELALQKKIMEEQTRINRAQERENEEMKIRIQQREEEWYKRKLELEAEAAAQRNEVEKSKLQSVKLQKYTITPFKGDYKDWLRFWNQFMVEVDGSCIPEISKFNYLLELVTGKPKEDILGLPHSEDGYKEAKRILEQTYGRDIKIHKALIKEMESLPAISSSHKIREVHSFYNKLSRIVRTLVTMKKLETAQSFVYTLMDRLGPIKNALVQKDDKWEEWKLEELVENLRQYTDRNPLPEDEIGISSDQPLWRKRNEGNQDWRGKRDRMLLASAQKTRRLNSCVYCGLSNHRSLDCFKMLDVASRKDFLKKNKLCFNCTGFGHIAANCGSRGCNKCSGKHHTSVCDAVPTLNIQDQAITRPNAEQGKRAIHANTAIHATLVAKVNGIPARVMIDSGSGSSYICTSLLTELKLKPSRVEKRIIEQMYGTVNRRVEIFELKLTSEAVEDFEMDLTCINGEKEILTYLPNPGIKGLKKKYDRFMCLSFSDEDTQEDKLPVHVILGTSDFQRIRTTEPLVLGPDPNHDPVAEFTMLGWTLSGRTGGNEVQAEKSLLMNSTKDEFEQMCSLEVLGLSDEVRKGEEFHENFKRNLKRLDDGTYSTRLPWKLDHCKLPTNKDLSLGRLRSTTRKLERLKKLEEYNDVMVEQLREGILEEVPKEQTGNIIHYIPHQPVIREEAESTKMRIVYDCSARANSQEPSLNDCLENGPPLQPHIFDILLRNRMKKYCITGDVKKAFLQIKLDPADRDAQRLFWYNNTEERKIIEYRFTRVIFGSGPSPYILGATFGKHIAQYKEEFPQTVKDLQDNTYVDDVQAGGDSEQDLIKFKNEATKIMNEGGFQLHKWHSNAPIQGEANKGAENGPEETTFAKVSVGTSPSETKILGVKWNTSSDQFTISFLKCLKKEHSAAVTKRKMLSTINSVFDLLGLASPVIITGKILYSQVCLMKCQWDEEVPEEIGKLWKRWINCLEKAPSVSVPRSVVKAKVVKMELHGFSDASKSAISAAVYIVVFYSSAEVSQHLLVSKSRIAPNKSIPRLELVGAHMLCRLVNHVRKTLEDHQINESHGWVDSTTVLHWLLGKGTWSQFVRNRTKIISESNFTGWHYVPTGENPSDLGTRGAAPEKLGRLWFQGPNWLHNKREWPNQPEIKEKNETKSEALPRKENQMLIKEVDVSDQFDAVLEKFPFWKMVRITAFVLRFIGRCKGQKIEEGLLTSKEIESAELFWIKKVQKSKEMAAETDLKKDADGIFRCSGRIPGYSPIFLPRNHKLVTSLIKQSHMKTLHGGVAITMCDVRERFWVQKLRSLVKRVVHNCNYCKRYRVKPLPAPTQAMLPDFRCQLSDPFSFTGVDFAGPIAFKIKKLTYGKCYVALFTCASTRAVHLKLCKDLSAPEFKKAMKEFVARRGCPHVMVSDNGKTFIATSKWLKILKKNEDLMNYMATHRIKWQFNLSRAPWWGGFFERLIGIMKRSLSKVIGKKCLTFSELEEILLDVECTMNNRPLCYQEEHLEQQVITPNVLLRGKPAVMLEEDLEKMPSELKLTNRLKFLSKSKEHLRKRWINEYLRALQERQNKSHKNMIDLPKIGAVVLLKEDTKNKAFWKLGRVVATIIGRDKVSRGLKIKLGNGNIVERPLQLVCNLEIGGDDLRMKLNPTAEEFIPEARTTRKAKTEASNQIKALALCEDDED